MLLSSLNASEVKAVLQQFIAEKKKFHFNMSQLHLLQSLFLVLLFLSSLVFLDSDFLILFTLRVVLFTLQAVILNQREFACFHTPARQCTSKAIN